MRYPLAPWCLVLFVLVGCGDQGREASADGTGTTQPAAPIPPEEVAAALASLSSQLQRQVGQLAIQLEGLDSSNATRRQTLRMRLRMADVCRQARSRDNAMAGLIELWFWSLATERYFSIGSGKDQFGGQQALVVEKCTALAASAEQVVRRAVPKEHFDGLQRQVKDSAAQGDAFLAGDSSQHNPIGGLLEVTRLEGVLNLALSPFDAFSGVKSGGDAAARIAITADRAVDLLAEYPQLLDWHLQSASIELQGQDEVKALLAEVRRTNTSLEAAITLTRGMPAQIRSEGVALLDQSRPAQADVRETLKALTEAATALERLNSGVTQLIARFTPPETATGNSTSADAPPSHPFDIREYTAALNAASVTARDLQQTLIATEKLVASPAIPSRIGEADQAAQGLIHTIGMWSLALLVTLATCVVVMVSLLRRS